MKCFLLVYCSFGMPPFLWLNDAREDSFARDFSQSQWIRSWQRIISHGSLPQNRRKSIWTYSTSWKTRIISRKPKTGFIGECEHIAKFQILFWPISARRGKRSYPILPSCQTDQTTGNPLRYLGRTITQ